MYTANIDCVVCGVRAEAEETVDVMETVFCLRRTETEVTLSIGDFNMLDFKRSAGRLKNVYCKL
jgi:hypothetical protein